MLELFFLGGLVVASVVGTAGVPMQPIPPAAFDATLPPQGEAAARPALAPIPTFAPEEDTGQFTTAAEVRPILSRTKDQWVSLREFEGQDLLYFTQIDSWRCGLSEVRVSVNGGPLDVREMEPCYRDADTPNEIRGEVAPYRTYGAGEVGQVALQIVYDDGTSDVATFDRAQIEE
ncbi:hypothetical protein BCF33_0363 [Hasllibacter halocynthiae]|uniref:Uncharacterized protein n=1 Tax=Hasllibacter halocynthiae TaxID=595589 RepID=A0A2T0X791_9RHOB|nr:hypothetical protein [Hasllibacter halocynthiae]PRY94765.1 hypothetical protein BCF33_0363 [Hasllibacter halocynthiae]